MESLVTLSALIASVPSKVSPSAPVPAPILKDVVMVDVIAEWM